MEWKDIDKLIYDWLYMSKNTDPILLGHLEEMIINFHLEMTLRKKDRNYYSHGKDLAFVHDSQVYEDLVKDTSRRFYLWSDCKFEIKFHKKDSKAKKWFDNWCEFSQSVLNDAGF